MTRLLKNELPDLALFSAIVEAGSFTRAAGQLGMSQSALSHAIRRLETRLGVRVLSRSNRSLSPTEAGERLLRALRPAFDGIEAEIAALSAFRERPAGHIRISSADHAADTILWPVMTRLMDQHPGIRIDLQVDNGLVDIVADRFDAGVRLGGNVARDMIAVPIGPPERLVTVASRAYLAERGVPQHPRDLEQHDAIQRSLPSLGAAPPWRFEKDGEQVTVRVSGRITSNRPDLVIDAARAGKGIAHVLASQVSGELQDGRLSEVLSDWARVLPGYHLYYPMRRQPTAAFSLMVSELRYRG